jgi:maltose alpha-D-glucosyltransferase/alpha-amylase
VFREFGPDENMRLYDRGIRRRLAPMLGNDRRRIELAYALQFSLRGTPVLRYGEEIGMGEDLALTGREAIRTPMQWSMKPNAGFSEADAGKLIRPVVEEGDFGYERVNVTLQRHDPGSLLAWFERMIRALREAPEIGSGSCTHIDQVMPPGVLAHRADGPTGTMVFLHNLGTKHTTVDLGSLYEEADLPNDVLTDRSYAPVGKLDALELAGQGYRWIRLRRGSAGRPGPM